MGKRVNRNDSEYQTIRLAVPPHLDHLMSNIQTLRFRRPIEKDKNEYAPKPVAARHTGILQDQLRRCVRMHQLAFLSEAGIPEPHALLGSLGSLWRSGCYSLSVSQQPCIRTSKTATKVSAFGVHHDIFPLSNLFFHSIQLLGASALHV